MEKVSLNNYINLTTPNTSDQTKSGESADTTQSAVNSNSIQDIYVSSSTSNAGNYYATYSNRPKSIDTTLDNTQLPVSVFNGFETEMPEVADIVSNLETTVGDFTDGNCSIDDVKSCIKLTYTNILNYNISLGRTDGTTESDNAHILNCVYKKFVMATNMKCQYANNDEGYALAAEDGLKPTSPFVYYNSKYYYAFSDIKQATIEVTQAIAAEQRLTDFNVSNSESQLPPTMGDFNEYWSGNVENNKKICTMLDTSVAPPKDFKLYFSQSTEYADKVFTGGDISKIDDGKLTIWDKNQSSTYTVPFDYYSDNVKQLFNASEIITKSAVGYNEFLRNFLLYRCYLFG